MKLVQRIKDNWKTIQSQPKGERFSYFWEYYKGPAIIAAVLVIALIWSIVALATRKEAVFTGYILNSNAVEKDEDFLQGFYDYAGIDSSKYEAAFYTDMYLLPGYDQKNADVLQRIMAGISMQDADFIAGQPEQFRMCAYNPRKIFMDLRKFLNKETLAKYADRLYYIDGAVLEQLVVPVGKSVNTSKIVYPNPHKPELMKDPIPVGIGIGDKEAFRSSYYYYPGTEIYIGVIGSTIRPELTRQFIEYILS